MEDKKLITLSLEEYNELIENVKRIKSGKVCYTEMEQRAYFRGIRDNKLTYNTLIHFITNEQAVSIAADASNSSIAELIRTQDKLEERIKEVVRLKELSIFGFIKLKLFGE